MWHMYSNLHRMRKLLFISLLLVTPGVFAQTTTTTNCNSYGNSVSCTSQSKEKARPVTGWEWFAEEGERKRQAAAQAQQQEVVRQQAAAQAQQQEVLRQQAENLRLQNELLRQQLDAAKAPARAEEVAAMQAAWEVLNEKELTLPWSDRMPPSLVSRIAINNAATTLGRQPSDEAIETFRRKLGLQ